MRWHGTCHFELRATPQMDYIWAFQAYRLLAVGRGGGESSPDLL